MSFFPQGRLLSTDEVAARLSAQTGTLNHRARDVGPYDQVIAEYVRESIYDLTTVAEDAKQSVYITAVTNNVRRQLGAVWPNLDRRRERRPSVHEQETEGDRFPDPVRRVIEALDDLREIAHLGNGYWAPSPTRLVKLNEETALAVGGVPTWVLARQLAAPISVHWIGRTVCIADLPLQLISDFTRWQSLPSWLGAPPPDLASWTDALFAAARGHLSMSAAALTDFDIYVPQANRTAPQAFRWLSVAALRSAPAALLLCRVREGRHSELRRYWLGTIKRVRGAWQADQEFPLEPSLVRRLQYGIDLQHGAPTEIQQKTTGSGLELTLKNPLPPEERRLLVAFGVDRSSHPGKFPLRYEVHATAVAVLRVALEHLGIRLVTV